MVYAAEKTLNDLGEKVPADVKSQVEDAAAKVREVKDGEDLDSIKKATDTLSEVMQKIGEAAYAQSADNQAPNPEPQSEASTDEQPGEDDEDVVDGEFKQV